MAACERRARLKVKMSGPERAVKPERRTHWLTRKARLPFVVCACGMGTRVDPDVRIEDQRDLAVVWFESHLSAVRAVRDALG